MLLIKYSCVGVARMQGLALKPRKGDATLFWSIRPGAPGCPKHAWFDGFVLFFVLFGMFDRVCNVQPDEGCGREAAQLSRLVAFDGLWSPLLLLVAAAAAATDGTFDVKSLHGSCPTLKGQKYSATKW